VRFGSEGVIGVKGGNKEGNVLKEPGTVSHLRHADKGQPACPVVAPTEREAPHAPPQRASSAFAAGEGSVGGRSASLLSFMI